MLKVTEAWSLLPWTKTEEKHANRDAHQVGLGLENSEMSLGWVGLRLLHTRSLVFEKVALLM